MERLIDQIWAKIDEGNSLDAFITQLSQRELTSDMFSKLISGAAQARVRNGVANWDTLEEECTQAIETAYDFYLEHTYLDSPSVPVQVTLVFKGSGTEPTRHNCQAHTRATLAEQLSATLPELRKSHWSSATTLPKEVSAACAVKLEEVDTPETCCLCQQRACAFKQCEDLASLTRDELIAEYDEAQKKRQVRCRANH
eukprot:TRINITY_DN27978_c0_g1_i2.p1 TRINITY_DN27978_c0_g1~~TRINITY_DN27978_c0_g1_i2.p1  ORF type:complete len:198 (+),score=5.05 TRINITY_DN27978_c0_g1_i2:44-637(+)